MKLKSLTLKNVRSHKNNEIIFNKGITVLTGRTGSGKSSILMGIDYALFGSENLSNSEIMRRGSREMLIKLEFEHNNKDYTIIRGLKRSNNRITIDFNNLSVSEGEKQLNVLSRAADVNAIITEILGIPESVTASQMFQVTSYTKQDEIRKILEMRKEERQDYIDRILQLSRYKTTFENLKQVSDYFNNKLEQAGKTEEFLTKEREEFEKIKKRLEEASEEISDNSKKLSVLEKALGEKEKEKNKLNSEVEELQNKILNEKEKMSELKSLKEQYEYNEKESVNLNSIKTGVEKKVKGKSRKEEEEEYNKLKTRIKVNEEKLKEHEEEKESISKIGGKCPLCKQAMSEEHRKEVIMKISMKIEELETKLRQDSKLVAPLSEDVKLLKQLEEVNMKLEHYDKSLDDLKHKISLIKIREDNASDKKLSELKKELNKIIEKDKELYSKKNSISEVLDYLNKEVKKLKEDYSGKEIIIKDYEEEIKHKGKVKYLVELLINLRNYVKDIRSVIRQKFLSDFRFEFQKKFEEIRNQEEEYSVELGFDYEPVAYTTSGEEVPVNHLSGGEKTSVALAYRLALSNLAAEMSNVTPAELLILDEPTTGFDAEDIKSLPEALKNITSIPQIIIVTHEPLLKEIADNNVEIRKEKNESIIEY